MLQTCGDRKSPITISVTPSKTSVVGLRFSRVFPAEVLKVDLGDLPIGIADQPELAIVDPDHIGVVAREASVIVVLDLNLSATRSSSPLHDQRRRSYRRLR